MNVLPSMLITAAIVCGTGNMPADFPALEVKTICEASDIASILQQLGVNSDSIGDCLLPSIPDAESPDSAPEISLPGKEDNDSAQEENTNPDTNTEQDNSPEQDNNSEQNFKKSYAQQVVELVNAERARAGLPALTMTDKLNQVALIRAKEIVTSFSHTRPGGTSFSTVLTENGIPYRSSGENIAWGQKTPEEVVNAWMNSEGHRANIMYKNFTSIGVGCYESNGTLYWAQLFVH